MTALDDLTADIGEVLRLIRIDPYGPTAKLVRDDLRRAHRIGVTRNYNAIRAAIRALPRDMLDGVLGIRTPCASIYREMLK